MSDDPDDLDMDDWMSLTEKQQDAILDREMDKYNRWYDRLPLKQKIRVDTRSAMRSILENRRRLQTPELCTIPYVVGLWRDGLRRGQLRLLKIRIWRSTGIYPGEG